MNSEKVENIKKDIEICTTKIGCEGCSLISIIASTNCRNKLLENCLTLINELKKENAKLKSTNTNILKSCDEYKNRHLKQFAERLKAKVQCVLDGHPEEKGTSSFYAISEYDIDETLKEMLGEE